MRGSQGWFARCPSPAPSLTHLPSRRQGQRRQRQARVCGLHRPTGVGYAVQGGRGHVPRHCSTFDLALIVVSPVMSSPLAVSLGWRPFACRRQQCHGEPSVGHESEEHRLRDIEAQSGALAHRHDRMFEPASFRGQRTANTGSRCRDVDRGHVPAPEIGDARLTPALGSRFRSRRVRRR